MAWSGSGMSTPLIVTQDSRRTSTARTSSMSSVYISNSEQKDAISLLILAVAFSMQFSTVGFLIQSFHSFSGTVSRYSKAHWLSWTGSGALWSQEEKYCLRA